MVAYQELQVAANSIKRIAQSLPSTAHLAKDLLALNDALSEFVAEMDFLMSRGELDKDALLKISEAAIAPLLVVLAERRTEITQGRLGK